MTVVLGLILELATCPAPLMAQRRGAPDPEWGAAGEVYWGGSVRVRYGRTSGIGLYPFVGYNITPRNGSWSVSLVPYWYE